MEYGCAEEKEKNYPEEAVPKKLRNESRDTKQWNGRGGRGPGDTTSDAGERRDRGPVNGGGGLSRGQKEDVDAF